MSSKASFFIIRSGEAQDGIRNCASTASRIVPLIPADMLPNWLEVKGFPRAMRLEETVGMTNIGSLPSSGQVLTVNLLPHQSGYHHVASQKESTDGDRSFLDDDASVLALDHDNSRNNGGLFMPPLSPTRPAYLAQKTSRNTVIEEEEENTTPLTTDMARLKLESQNCQRSANKQTIPWENKNEEVDKDEREVCSFWCKTGWCKFDGHCRYKHEMPQSIAGLAEVGLEAFPGWWMGGLLQRAPRAAVGLTVRDDEASVLLGGSGSGSDLNGKAPSKPKKQQQQQQHQRGKNLARSIHRLRPAAASEARMEKSRSGHRAGEVTWRRMTEDEEEAVAEAEAEGEEVETVSPQAGESTSESSKELVDLVE